MSEYEKFFGDIIDVEIAGVKCQMKPLTVADMGLLAQLQGDDTRPAAIKKVLIKTMIPTITEDQVGKISIKHFPEILKKIMEINGIEQPQEDVAIPPEA